MEDLLDQGWFVFLLSTAAAAVVVLVLAFGISLLVSLLLRLLRPWRR
jgi:hypothetical protein